MQSECPGCDGRKVSLRARPGRLHERAAAWTLTADPPHAEAWAVQVGWRPLGKLTNVLGPLERDLHASALRLSPRPRRAKLTPTTLARIRFERRRIHP